MRNYKIPIKINFLNKFSKKFAEETSFLSLEELIKRMKKIKGKIDLIEFFVYD